MIEKEEISVLMKVVGNHVREFVSAALVGISSRIDALDQRIKEIPAGPQGIQGIQGERGPQGEAIKGDIGPVGPAGPQGDVGPSGAQGERGLSVTGERGIDGPIGPAGKDGADGAVGPQGEKGIDGKDGAPGVSILGEKGADGKDGRDGRDAKDGADGKDGPPGRDALQIEILPMVVDGKSYPRGTFAKMNGGLVRAIRNTETADDWEVIVDGVASMNMKHDSARFFSFEQTLTSGKKTLDVFTLPVLIYREIFKDGTTYEHGDVVTWAGSAWHCQVESTKAKPGEGSTDWRLMVKRGGDGKPGTNGSNGDPGPQGPAGKDLTQIGTDGRKH